MQNVYEDMYEKRLQDIEKTPEDLSSPDLPKRKSQADKLVELVEVCGVTLFQDQMGEPYAHVPINGHYETLRIKSRGFKRWVSKVFWDVENKAPSPNALQSAFTILEGKAVHEGKIYSLENRLAVLDGTIWYDLGDSDWRALKITKEGWQIENNPPILFRRYNHQKTQSEPLKDVKIEDLRQFLDFTNIPDPHQQILILVYIVACFIPDIPHPISIFYGPQGASKTTLGRMLRSLIDPSIVGVLSLSNHNELPQHLSHHWFAFFDNITTFSDQVSDMFCRAVTGEGFMKRELYTDEDDVIYVFRRCVGFNGINLAAYKPDLLDRALLFRLDRIVKEKRKTESEIWTAFDKAKPSMLGAIVTAISKAMVLKETVVLKEKPRMADFTVWGCAIAEALGFTQEQFLNAYYANINYQHLEAIQESPIAVAIIHFMKMKQEWQGTATQLLEELNTVATELHLDTYEKYWPKAPNTLSRRLNEVKTNLGETGISIDLTKISDGSRIIKMYKRTENSAVTADTAEPVQEGQILPGDTHTLLPEQSPVQNQSEENETGRYGDNGDVS